LSIAYAAALIWYLLKSSVDTEAHQYILHSNAYTTIHKPRIGFITDSNAQHELLNSTTGHSISRITGWIYLPCCHSVCAIQLY